MARPKSNSAQIAYDTIKDRINHFDLMPGDIVSDFLLSKELEMSRTPIREAIVQLMQSNLIEKENNKFVVKPITFNDIKEILEVRQAVETMSAILIMRNGGLNQQQFDELEEIEKNLKFYLDKHDYNNNFKYDSLFHYSLVKFSGNSRLLATMDNLILQGERLRWLSILTPQRYYDVIDEHNEILRVMHSDDPIQISNYIGDHIQSSLNNYEKITKNDSWLNIIKSMKNLS